MAKHNSIIFSGKVFNPELKTFGEKLKFKFTLAIDISYKKKDSQEWVNKTIWKDVVMWGRQAEMWQNLVDREEIIVEGRLDQDEWESDDGKKRYKDYIVPTKITVLEKKVKEEKVPF